MLEFLIDNIFVVLAGKVFQQIVGIPLGTNFAPLVADLFIYSYEAKFIQTVLSTGRKHLASRFNFTYRYIDDVLSLNKPEFENYLRQMYPVEPEIKDTTETNTSAAFLDLLLPIVRDDQFHTSIYDKRNDFNFHITNFPFLSRKIPASPERCRTSPVWLAALVMSVNDNAHTYYKDWPLIVGHANVTTTAHHGEVVTIEFRFRTI